MMLTALNSLFDTQSDRILCHNLHGKDNILLSDLHRDIRQLRLNILTSDPVSERWLLLLSNPYSFIVGLLTLLSMNKKVIISSNTTPLWLKEMSEYYDGGLTDDKDHSSKMDINIINYSHQITSKSQPEPLWKPEFTGNETILFFTSGSTGKAKTVEKKLCYITNEVLSLNNCFKGISDKAIFISSVSHFHIYGLLFNLFWPLLTKRVWMNSQIEYQEQLIEQLTVGKDSVFISSPAFLSRLDHISPQEDIGYIFSSGGPLKFITAQIVQTRLGNYPIEVFGSTETGGIAFRQQFTENNLWQLFDEVRLIPNEDKIKLTSPHVSSQEPVFLDDQIKFYDNNMFLLLGRKDRVVKLEEKRVSLNEIEDFLKDLDMISDCVALVVEGKRSIISCVITLSKKGEKVYSNHGKKVLVTQLKQLMRGRFESVTIPKKWRILDSIPMNTQSKIDRPFLQQLFSKNISAS